MKELIIVALILVLVLCIKIRIKVYKQVNQKIIVNLIITKSLRIKINLTNYLNKKFKNYIYDTSKEKKVYDIKFSEKGTPIENRKAKEFSYYYDMIWKDIDAHV